MLCGQGLDGEGVVGGVVRSREKQHLISRFQDVLLKVIYCIVR